MLKKSFIFFARLLAVIALIVVAGGFDPLAIVHAQTVLSPGTYDDLDGGLTYSAGWSFYSGAGWGMYNDTQHFSTVIGSQVTATFNGSNVAILYSGSSNRGVMSIQIDGVDVQALNQFSASYTPQRRWDSAALTSGVHTLKLTHASGRNVDLDALVVGGTQGPTYTPTITLTPPGIGNATYFDDTNAAFKYPTGFVSYTGAGYGMYNNTQHYSTVIGSTATFTFTGGSFVVLYSGNTSRGVMEIKVDGNLLATVNQYAAVFSAQQRWTSPTLVVGTHKVTMRHASGNNMDIDAIVVYAGGIAPTATPPVPRSTSVTLDDTDPGFAYTSGYTFYRGSGWGFVNNTQHYSNVLGSMASITFTGDQISVVYSGNTSRGNMDVIVDNVKIATINQYATSFKVNQSWTSAVLTGGPTHTLQLKHALGRTVDLDALIVITYEVPTATPLPSNEPSPTITPTLMPIATSTPIPTATVSIPPTPLATMVSYESCPMPANSIWRAAVDSLPLDANSQVYANSLDMEGALIPDFGAGLVDGDTTGIPYNVVNSGAGKVAVEFDYNQESDPGPYPMPPSPVFEGGATSEGDRHVLILEKDTCRLYEMFRAYSMKNGGGWSAFSGAIYDLNSNALRPAGWISADRAGLPILPILLRYDEVANGNIQHVLRFTVPTGRARSEYVWPARRSIANRADANLPPVGQRFRLKASFDVSGYPAHVQTILNALKKHGMILAGESDVFGITGTPDGRWNNAEIGMLSNLRGSDFEAVDVSSLKVSDDSAEVR